MQSFLLKSFIIISLIISISCNNENNIEDINKQNKNDVYNSNDNSKTEDNSKNQINFIEGPGIVFFSLNDNEYKAFVNQMGLETKWEFDIIYNNFKKTVDNSETPLKSKNIQFLYTTQKITGFISNEKDTFYFDRSKDNYFVGQVLFDGIDSVYITEGLYKSEKLEDLIIDFFRITDDFNISHVPEISDSFRYYSPDTTVINIPDSL